MAVRTMKWHIVNRFNGACAVDDDGRAFEFSSEESALKYLERCEPQFIEEAEIMQGILYYDGGYIDYDEGTVDED